MAEGFRFMPFGSVHGLIRCNINAGVHARGRSGRVTQRCHNSPGRKRDYRVQVTSRTGSARRIWGILKKSVTWVLPREKTVDFHLLAEALLRAPHEMEGRWKSQNRKNVYLSSYVEEPLNSKVIKSLVSELRSRKCFSCFEIPMFDVYMLWIFYVRFTCIRIMGMVQPYHLLFPMESCFLS